MSDGTRRVTALGFGLRFGLRFGLGLGRGQRRGCIGRWFKRIAALAILFALLACGAWVTRAKTLHPLVVRFAPSLSRTFTDFEVSVDKIEGDWWSVLAVHGLRVVPEKTDTPLRELNVHRAEVTGRLLRLARTGDLEALDGIVVEAPRVDIDLTAGATGAEPSDKSRFTLPSELPTVLVSQGQVTLRAESGTTTIENIEARGAGTRAAPLSVSARAAAENWTANFSADAYAEGDGGISFDGRVPDAVARGVEASARDLAGRWNPRSFELDSGTVAIGENTLSIEGVTLSRREDGPTIGGHITFAFDDIQSASTALATFMGSESVERAEERWRGSASGSVELVPAPGGSFATGTIDVSGEGVVVDGVRLGRVRALVDAEDERLHVREITANDPESETSLHASGSYSPSTRTLLDVVVEGRVDQPSRLAGGEDSGLDVLAGVAISVNLEGPLDSPTGTIQLTANEILTPGFFARDLDVRGPLEDGVLDLTIRESETRYGRANARAEVTLPLGGRALALVVRELTLESEGKALVLQETATIELPSADDQTLRIEGVHASGSAGTLEADVRVSALEGTTVTARADSLYAGPFVRSWIGDEIDLGALDGSVTFASEPFDLRADLVLEGGSLRGLAGADEPVTAALRGNWTGERITVEELRAEAYGARVEAQGQAPLSATAGIDVDGPVEVSFDAAASPEMLRSKAAQSIAEAIGVAEVIERLRLDGVEIDVELAGTWSALEGRMATSAQNVSLARPSAGDQRVPDDWFPKPVSLDLDLRIDDALRVSQGRVSAPGFADVEITGRVERGLDLRALAQSSSDWLEAWRGAPVDADVRIDSQSLSELAVFTPELRETSGSLDGDVELTGTIGAPKVGGELRLTGGGARYRGAPPIDNATMVLALESDQIRIDDLRFDLGASPVEVTGNMLLGQGKPRIDLEIDGEEILLVRSADARVRADLDLEVRGRTNALVVDGTVSITGGRVRSPIEFQSLLSSGGAAPKRVDRGIRIPAFGPEFVKLDLDVTTKNALRLDGRIARGGLRTDIELRGSAAEPVPIGSVFLDPLELAVPAGTVTFPSGLVQFDPNQPDIPRIDIVGQTRLAGYDVTVNVSGDYDQAEVDLSSSPPLPPEDLLLLVLSGQPPQRGGGLGAAGQSVALYVAKDLVRGWFSSGGFDDEDRESFLDRLEVVTGRDVSRSGTVTVEATYKLREGFARDRDALYVVLERDTYEDYGLGLRLVLRMR